jgi:hypothetical protein
MAPSKSTLLLALALLAIIAANECLATPLNQDGALTAGAPRHLTMEKWWCEYKGKRYESWKGYSKEYEYYWDKEYKKWCCYDYKFKRGYWSDKKC